ncbi:helix-turn-helix domain-containing protein [Paracoccus denitrificans]|uniref:helix-turn-helix domain-containing protein n=1 Tax=Paracoccus denitrificans TaxID=266 RepID=UPI003364C269
MSDQSVAAALRALRQEAGVGVREMARRIGAPSPSSYAHYEDPKRFKDPYLPMAWAIRFADALEQNGIDRARVIALAGATEQQQGEGVEARMSRLSRKRYDMLLNLLADLEAAEEADRERQGKDGDEKG